MGSLDPNAGNATLSIQTPLQVKEVFSTLAGHLPWKREGDRIVIDMPPPVSVDVVILR
jgi:hypothetical protein